MKKKICLVFNHFQYQDGVCRSAIAIANLLAEKGVDVTLIPIYKCENKTRRYLNPSVNIKSVFGFYFKGFTKIVHLIPSKWLYKYIIREFYDVEIAFQYGTSTGVMAASTCKESKHFAWIHGYSMSPKYKELYSHFDKVINVARGNCDRFRRDTDSKIDVDYCYNPIDDKFIVEQGAKEIVNQNITGLSFVSVGRLSPEKGYNRLLDICQKLKSEGYRFHLNLIGSGPSSKELRNKSSELDIDDYVTFLGSQENPHKFTCRADLFICSSFTEGYSMACTEAVMLGIPVLSTNVSGAKEIVEDSGAGLVVDMDDQSLYEGIKKVLDNPQIIEDWKKTVNANKHKFSQEYRAQRLFNILDL